MDHLRVGHYYPGCSYAAGFEPRRQPMPGTAHPDRTASVAQFEPTPVYPVADAVNVSDRSSLHVENEVGFFFAHKSLYAPAVTQRAQPARPGGPAYGLSRMFDAGGKQLNIPIHGKSGLEPVSRQLSSTYSANVTTENEHRRHRAQARSDLIRQQLFFVGVRCPNQNEVAGSKFGLCQVRREAYTMFPQDERRIELRKY